MIKLSHILQEQTSVVLYDFNKSSKRAGQDLFDYIRSHEKFVPYTYDDGIYPSEPYKKGTTIKGTLTIGYGTTNTKYAVAGNQITKAEAEKLSVADINEAAECIRRWQARAQSTDVNGRKLTLSMYKALIDITYNIGCNNIVNSLLIKYIEQGKYTQAIQQIKTMNWGHASRRESTAAMFEADGTPLSRKAATAPLANKK